MASMESSDAAGLAIDKTSVLGAGAYGAVYLARWNELTCAAKVIHETLFMFDVPGKPNIAKQLEKECEVISKFRHPNVVQFIAMVRDPDTQFPVLLMELMDKSLTVYLEESDAPLLYSTQLGICHDVALAMTYLHFRRFIHRDITSNNVLMRGKTAKLTDLGVSLLMDSDAVNRLSKCPGTEAYMPPNSVADNPEYTAKMDCFSYGVLMVQVLTRIFPSPTSRYCGADLGGGASNLLRRVPEVERRKDHIAMVSRSHPFFELIHKCLKDEESDRPSSTEICCYVGHLRDIEKREGTTLTGASGGGAESTTEESPRMKRLKDSLEMSRLTVAALEREITAKDEQISRLEGENDALQDAAIVPSQSPVPSPMPAAAVSAAVQVSGYSIEPCLPTKQFQ